MRWLLLLLACLHLAVLAADGERTRIAAERQALLERFAQEERECQQRFAVTTCLDDVRSRRRAALAPLRARELQLDDAERQQRAADRRAAIEAKQKAQAARPPPTPAPEVRLRPPPVPPVPASSASAASAPRHKTDDAQARAAQAAERAQAAQRRREAAEADRQRIERRLAEREAAGKVAAPLPVPSSAPGH